MISCPQFLLLSLAAIAGHTSGLPKEHGGVARGPVLPATSPGPGQSRSPQVWGPSHQPLALHDSPGVAGTQVFVNFPAPTPTQNLIQQLLNSCAPEQASQRDTMHLSLMKRHHHFCERRCWPPRDRERDCPSVRPPRSRNTHTVGAARWPKQPSQPPASPGGGLTVF